MAVQLYKFTKSNWTVHLKPVNFMGYKLSLSKTIKNYWLGWKSEEKIFREHDSWIVWCVTNIFK